MYLKPAESEAGRGHDGGVLQRAGLLEGAAHGGDGRALLADGDVDAAHLLGRVAGLPVRLLVDDRVDRDRGLAGRAVTDDQLALAAADRGHRVDGLDAGRQRLVHRLALHHAGGLELQGAAALDAGDLAEAVDRVAERVDDAAEVAVADRDREDLAGPLDRSGPPRSPRSHRGRRRRSRGCRGSGRCPGCRPRTRAARWPSPRAGPRPGRCRHRPRPRCRPLRGWRSRACSPTRTAAARPGSPPDGSKAPSSLFLTVRLL